MADGADAIKVEVLVYPDGGTQVSVPPVNDLMRVRLLESAAAALQRAADSVVRDQEPVTCSTCGEVADGVQASVAGAARLLPCGHFTS